MLTYGRGFTGASFANMLSLTRNAQAPSNFRPGYALSLLRRFAPAGGSVFDASAGYGGRLVGFLASHCAEYVGVEPASITYDGNLRLAGDLCPDSKSVELVRAPAEDVELDLVRDRFDVALTSPPYFSKEHYSDEPTQSWRRYPDPAAWRDGFLVPLLRLQHAALRAGGVNVLNIADVEVDRQTVPLVEWTLDAAREAGFEIETIERYPMHRHFGRGIDERVDPDGALTEPVLIMRKGGS
jgi:hypothetical protein